MARRDNLLEASPSSDQVGAAGNRDRRKPRRRWIKWIGGGHLLVGIILMGWQHASALWPNSLWPDGIAIGSGIQTQGLLTIGDHGQAARFETADVLIKDWHRWLHLSERDNTGKCISVPADLRQRLPNVPPRPDSGGLRQYWINGTIGDRLKPTQCSNSGEIQFERSLASITSVVPIACSHDLFVANGLSCPIAGQPRRHGDTAYASLGDYYPVYALRAAEEGRVTVRIERDDSGSPTRCTVVHSSGHQDLDVQTCKLVGSDPNFTIGPAAIDSLSTPITQSVMWKVPDD